MVESDEDGKQMEMQLVIGYLLMSSVNKQKDMAGRVRGSRETSGVACERVT